MGTMAYNSGTTTPTADTQPTISQRCPDYPGSGNVFGARNEIWIEIVTAMTSATAWQVQVTYKNQAGTAGRTSIISPAQAAAALTVGKMFMLGLQSGDTGVQRIESVIVTTGAAAAGTFNVLITRPIWTSGRCMTANDGDIHDMLKTGLPVIYSDSALIIQVQADGTASGVPEVAFEICNG
jgi:phage tail sheath gpL-like